MCWSDNTARIWTVPIGSALQQTGGSEQIRPEANGNWSTKTCMACLEDKPTVQFPTRVASSCTHDSNMRWACLQQWIGKRLDANGANIPCPECGGVMSFEDVKRISTESQFKRFVTPFILLPT